MKIPNKILNLRNIVIVAFALALSGVLLAQQESTPTDNNANNNATAPATTSNPRRLVVNGRNTSVSVRRIDGHSYVDLENLAQATNGSVTFEPNRIVLTIPGGTSSGGAASGGTSSAQSAQNAAANQRLSRDFAAAANYAVSDIREWKGVLSAMVIYGTAVNSGWGQEYRHRVQTDVTQASVSATTDADRNALQLLQNQFNNLSNWAGTLESERSDFNGARTVDPSSLNGDQTLQRITDCDRFLNSMLVSGSFSDSACH